MGPPKPPLLIWQSAPHALTISPKEIHLWQAWLGIESVQLDIFYQQLSDDEQARSDRFRDQKDRERYIAAHGSLQAILSRYLHVEPIEVTFHRNEFGKPSLQLYGSEDIRFNMSRSDDMSLMAIARGREVGVDIERIRHLNDSMQIAEQFFCPGERSFLRTLEAEGQQEAFFRLWTLKEAFVKGRGQGLSIPLDHFEVAFQDERPVLLGTQEGVDIDVQDWSLVELNAHPGYAAALAAEGPMRCISFWRLDHTERIDGQDG